MLLGDGGGKRLLNGSEKLGLRCIWLFSVAGNGMLTGDVSECSLDSWELPTRVGGEGESDVEHGGESLNSPKPELPFLSIDDRWFGTRCP